MGTDKLFWSHYTLIMLSKITWKPCSMYLWYWIYLQPDASLLLVRIKKKILTRVLFVSFNVYSTIFIAAASCLGSQKISGKAFTRIYFRTWSFKLKRLQYWGPDSRCLFSWMFCHYHYNLDPIVPFLLLSEIICLSSSFVKWLGNIWPDQFW